MSDNNIINEPDPEFPKPFSITIWMVYSSITFLVPAIYAFLNTAIYSWLYWYGILSVGATIFSVNHWRQAEYGIRRNMDRIVAWVACIIYVITGLLYLPGYLSIATLGAITSTYILSNNLSPKHHPSWPIVHVLFHLSVSMTKCFIIYYIIDNELV